MCTCGMWAREGVLTSSEEALTGVLAGEEATMPLARGAGCFCLQASQRGGTSGTGPGPGGAC